MPTRTWACHPAPDVATPRSGAIQPLIAPYSRGPAMPRGGMDQQARQGGRHRARDPGRRGRWSLWRSRGDPEASVAIGGGVRRALVSPRWGYAAINSPSSPPASPEAAPGHPITLLRVAADPSPRPGPTDRSGNRPERRGRPDRPIAAGFGPGGDVLRRISSEELSGLEPAGRAFTGPGSVGFGRESRNDQNPGAAASAGPLSGSML
jgi:hypothetical protein